MLPSCGRRVLRPGSGHGVGGSSGVPGHRVASFGFPAHAPRGGLPAADTGADRLLQLSAADDLTTGFSDGPVVDEMTGLVGRHGHCHRLSRCPSQGAGHRLRHPGRGVAWSVAGTEVLAEREVHTGLGDHDVAAGLVLVAHACRETVRAHPVSGVGSSSERRAGLAPASPRRKRGVFPWTTNARPAARSSGDRDKIHYSARHLSRWSPDPGPGRHRARRTTSAAAACASPPRTRSWRPTSRIHR